MLGFLDVIILALTVLALYFIIKLAVKSAITELKKDRVL